MNIDNVILANYLKQVPEYKTMIFMLHVVTWIRDPSNKYSKKGSCVENVTRPLRENFQFPCKFANIWHLIPLNEYTTKIATEITFHRFQ